MMKHSLLVAALVCASACSKKDADSASGAGGTPAAAGSCADSIGKAITAMTDKVKGRMGSNDMSNPMVERMEKLKGALVSHCTTDKWPEAVITCFATAASRGDMKKCQDPLNAEQKMALEADVTKLMLGPMGGRHAGRLGSGGSGGGPMMGHNEPADPAAGSGSAAPAPAGSGSGSAM